MTTHDASGEYPHLTEYVSLKELADNLKVDRSTVRRNMRRAGISALEFGGCVRYRKADVDRLLQSLMTPAPATREKA